MRRQGEIQEGVPGTDTGWAIDQSKNITSKSDQIFLNSILALWAFGMPIL